MSDSYMLLVEKALTEHLETQITANGVFDLTQAVYRGRGRIGGYNSQEPLPMLSLIMAPEVEPETIEAGLGRSRTRKVLYFIQGWAERGDLRTETDEAHRLLAETKRALATVLGPEDGPYYMLRDYSPAKSNLLASFDMGLGIVRPPEEDVSPTVSYFWLPVLLGLIENPADPYGLP